jgi:hypothetical protein
MWASLVLGLTPCGSMPGQGEETVDEAGATWSEQPSAHPLIEEGGARRATPTGCPVHTLGLQQSRLCQ